MNQILEGLKQENLYKKYQLDLKFHAKQMVVERVALIGAKEDIKKIDDLTMDYPCSELE